MENSGHYRRVKNIQAYLTVRDYKVVDKFKAGDIVVWKVSNYDIVANYPAIISKTFPTINPPKVPSMYPIIAISTPMGMRALE